MFWGESPDRRRLLRRGVPQRRRPQPRQRRHAATTCRGAPWSGRSPTSTTSPTKWAQIGVSARARAPRPTRVGYDLPRSRRRAASPSGSRRTRDSARAARSTSCRARRSGASPATSTSRSSNSTSPASSSTRSTTRARPSTATSCRRYTERLGALKGYGWYAQVGLLDHRRPRHHRLPELRAPHSRRSAAQPQRAAHQGLQAVAQVRAARASPTRARRAAAPATRRLRTATST